MSGGRRLAAVLAVLIGVFCGVPSAHAHLMVAQRGTLNLLDDAAYLVLSLPVSAFQGIDDDGDGRLSLAELRAHAADIEAQVQSGVQLRGPDGPFALEGLMLSLSPPEHGSSAPGRQLVVMGRFSLTVPALAGLVQQWLPIGTPLTLQVGLFGRAPTEQRLDVTVTHQQQTQWMRFEPGRQRQAIFPPPWQVAADHLRLGALHVLSGPDHLLFLLVVLAAGLGLRQLLLSLSCFTIGHAVTLAACAWAGLAVPAGVVEPAIAATIVGMAAFDRWWAARPAAADRASWLRPGMVFGCALIHGLGMAGALTDLGLDSWHVLWSVAGFNAGIELAQVGVALLALGSVASLRALFGPGAPALATRLASLTAMLVGSVWLVQRLCEA